jgi:hypothetical protein
MQNPELAVDLIEQNFATPAPARPANAGARKPSQRFAQPA